MAIASSPASTVDDASNADRLNEDRFIASEESIRKRALMLEGSYQGSDPLPVVDSFDSDVRRLKQSLDAFERASRP